MTSRQKLMDRYPPEQLDLDRLNANIAVVDAELADFRAALPILRQECGKTLEATRCSVLIDKHEKQKDELMALVAMKKEWIEGHDEDG